MKVLFLKIDYEFLFDEIAILINLINNWMDDKSCELYSITF